MKKFVAAKRETVRDASLGINEPDRATEFEVQASIWIGLRACGINARGEVCVPFSGRAKVRFDVAIFEEGTLAGVVEVKSAPIRHASTWERTRQGARYMQFGVPVRMVYGMAQAEELLRDAKQGCLFPETARRAEM